ncbi:hypothetical protein QYS60_02040 [Rhodococcus sp. GXMU-t2271]|uniref:Uncharacterized protein n=3 Tax=Rhodococcus TaxID=1827 RepID=M3A1H1_9NOCA|nr:MULTISPECIES: hypothetical protein [Rhodococcus]EME66833.1 hypothetical protein G352_02814 [Rhodococcus ruber BKS 20-38]KOS57651.1 hypothetical protein Z051_02470 [Rhodococcus rhodochrous KG-21]MDM7491210.1 hypothetical protein [Rhodococcus indonesiensis]
MSTPELARQASQLRADLHAFDRRIQELSEEFGRIDRHSHGDSAEAALLEILDLLADARLDLRSVDRHLETTVRHAESLH